MTDLATLQTDPLLARFVLGYTQDPRDFVAESLAPIISGVPTSGTYYKWHRRTNFRDYSAVLERRPLGEFSQVTSENTSDTYKTTDYGLKDGIDRQEYDAAASAGRLANIRRQKAQMVSDLSRLGWESIVATALRNTSNLTQNTTLSGTSQWSAYSTSDPISVIETGRETILSNTGKLPNVLVIPWQVFTVLKRHPDLLERDGRTNVRDLGEADMAKLFNVERVVIAKAIVDTAAETASDAMTGGFVWGKDVILSYVERSPADMARSLAYTFQNRGWTPREWDSQDGNTHWVQVYANRVLKLTDVKCAYLIKTAVA